MTRRDTLQLLRRLPAGWSWSVRRGGHIRVAGPRGALVFTSASPSDRRTVRNLRAQLRRAGAPL